MAKTSLSPIASMIRHLSEEHQTKTLSDQELLRRFSGAQDEVAFGSLLRRHGSMVLNVCRNVACSEEDAEDAFQATFIVLARKANSIRKMASAASWLHGVAYRTALHGRKTSASRQKHESRAGLARGRESVDDLSWREAQHLIHAELTALAESCRAPLVLCFLEGKTQDEAAKQLNISKTTLKKRLERGRALLRVRLLRRGLGPAAILAACSWPAATVSACLPRVLATATVKAATAFVSGQASAGLVSGQVAILVASALKATFATKLKVAATVLLALAFVPTMGGVWFKAQSPSANGLIAPGTAPTRANDKSTIIRGALADQTQEAPGDEDSILFGGKVLAPDGRGVTGAKIYVNHAGGYHWKPNLEPEVATTGPNGTFGFKLPKRKFDDGYLFIAAMAPNYGAALAGVQKDTKRNDLTLHLVNDAVPIDGQIIDLEGKPVPNATLRVLQIHAAPGEDLGPWLKAIENKEGPVHNRSWRLEQKYLEYTTALSPVAKTGVDGRFRLSGIGSNRMIVAQLDGPTVASEYLRIITRQGKTMEVAFLEKGDYRGEGPHDDLHVYYGAKFRHAAGPTRAIVGVVRDKATGKPLSGVMVQSEKLATSIFHGTHIVKTTTNDEGRYRLTGMPIGSGNVISLVFTKDQPYLTSDVVVPHTPGLDPVSVDIKLKRGVWIKGKITDKVTGKPLKGVVQYIAMSKNPNLPEYPEVTFSLSRGPVGTNEDGSYRIVGLPGPGVVCVLRTSHYLTVEDRDDQFGGKEKEIRTYTYIILQNYCAIARIDPGIETDATEQDITLDPGWTFLGTVFGLDGNPLTEEARKGLTGRGWIQGREKNTNPFTSTPYNPLRASDVLFLHSKLGLIGVAKPPEKNGGIVNVRLEAGATVTGRLEDVDGKARRGVELTVSLRLKDGSRHDFREPIQTDQDGKFQIRALLPGHEYRLSDGKGRLTIGAELRLGHTTDLGDVKITEKKE